MSVDVSTDVVIDAPIAVVAAFAGEPSNAPRWYVNIASAEWRTQAPLRVGSRIAFIANFLGRRLEYTYEIAELIADTRLVMRTAEGPFPMETTYEWRSEGPTKTRMTLRNRGRPSGLSSVIAPAMAWAMRRAMTKDLLKLKSILEGVSRP